MVMELDEDDITTTTTLKRGSDEVCGGMCEGGGVCRDGVYS